MGLVGERVFRNLRRFCGNKNFDYICLDTASKIGDILLDCDKFVEGPNSFIQKDILTLVKRIIEISWEKSVTLWVPCCGMYFLASRRVLR